MHSKNFLRNVLLMAAICIGYAFLAGRSGTTAHAANGSCSTVFDCAQKAVEAAQAAQQAAQNANRVMATQMMALQKQIDDLKAATVRVNDRVGGITLTQGAELSHTFNCQAESREFEKYPGQVVTMVGQRPCATQLGATYFKILTLSIPPVK